MKRRNSGIPNIISSAPSHQTLNLWWGGWVGAGFPALRSSKLLALRGQETMETAPRPHPLQVSKKDHIPTTIHPVDHQEQRHGRVGAFFAKVFRQKSKGHDPEKATARSIEKGVVIEQVEAGHEIEVPQTQTQSELPQHGPLQVDKLPLIPLDSSNLDETPTIESIGRNEAYYSSRSASRRSQAETRLQISAEALNKAIAKATGTVSSPFRVPDAIGLQTVDEYGVDDIPQTARSIEAAIDGFIDMRECKMSIDSRALWKSCASNLFKAFYPYLKKCLSDIGVSLLWKKLEEA
jgi:hypothetical protein